MLGHGSQFVRAEDDRTHEHSFEPGHQPAIVLPVSREAEFGKDLVAGVKRELAAAKADGLCRHPDGHQAVLSKREAEVRMSEYLQEKAAVLSRVCQLILRRPA